MLRPRAFVYIVYKQMAMKMERQLFIVNSIIFSQMTFKKKTQDLW